MPFLSVGRAGLEPAYSLLIGQEPSPFWPPASGSESQHRTDDLRPMKPALWPTELSRHGWPPRDRTALYLRIRQAPSTSWVAASRWWRNRASDASQRPIPLQTGACRQAGSPSKGRERSIRSPPPRDGHPLSGRRLQPWQVHSPRRKVHGSNVCGRTRPPVSSGALYLSVNLP